MGFALVALAANAQPPALPADSASSFIDEEIRGAWKLAKVTPAAPASDEQFLRRIYLDLTGRIPTADEIRAFLANPKPSKRAEVVDQLLNSDWFSDRWAQWFADLGHVSHNVLRGYTGRNAYYHWIRNGIQHRMSLSDLAIGIIASQGNNYDDASGAVNFTLVQIPSGPPQDRADAIFARTASTFLGMGQYDCLLCHDGRGHLDSLSLWGSRSTRLEAWQMASFFARTGYNRVNTSNNYFDSNTVADALSGNYRLDTRYGNRPARTPVRGVDIVHPTYSLTGPLSGKQPETENWRLEFARLMVRDPIFARNFANRFWKQMMGTALVEPVEGLDPDRLDPAKPPPRPWTLQASHPVLLEKLAAKLVETGFDYRALLRMIALSSTYQLSSKYESPWRPEYERIYVRHKARRMEAEAVHDAVAISTGVLPNYRIRVTVGGYLPERVHWANQFPGQLGGDELEPTEMEFFEAFFPGDRNLLPRTEAGSTRQELNLMNSTFVNSRLRMDVSPTLQQAAALKKDGDAVDFLFLTFLSRHPDAAELAAGVQSLKGAWKRGGRGEAIEDLAWVCVNKVEFIVNP